MLRIGHKGADLIEPGNTRASFDAALQHGVDMIELDVLPARPGGELILAHDYGDAAERTPLTIEDGFTHLASDRFAGIEFIVDLKLPGYERRVLDALVAHGLRDRALVSSTYKESLVRLRTCDKELRIGWSVPRARRDYTSSKLLALPALAVLQVMRRTLPRQAERALREGLCNAVMAHWRLVSPKLVRAIDAGGGDLYVWTVDHAPRIRELKKLGVTGVITNDPRLFAALS
jgi:glycerophosphoryl diester phosphodiesterase